MHANKNVAGMISNEPVIILEDDVEFLPVIREVANDVEDFVAGYRVRSVTVWAVSHFLVFLRLIL